MKIKGNEKYDSIQLQCHSTSLSTQPNPSHVLENATRPNAWMDPTHVPSLGHPLSPSVLSIAPALPPLGSIGSALNQIGGLYRYQSGLSTVLPRTNLI